MTCPVPSSVRDCVGLSAHSRRSPVATGHGDRDPGLKRAPIWADPENPQTPELQKAEAERLLREHPSQPFHFAVAELRPREGQSRPVTPRAEPNTMGSRRQLPSPRAAASRHLLRRGDILPAVELGCRTLHARRATAKKLTAGPRAHRCLPWGTWVLTDTQGWLRICPAVHRASTFT